MTGDGALWEVKLEVFSRAFSFFEVWERIPQLATRHPLELWSHGWRLLPDGIHATATVRVRASGEDAARAHAAAMLFDVLASPPVSATRSRRLPRGGRPRQRSRGRSAATRRPRRRRS
jgi:hypothetical protein